jgi:hypothetical protein
MVRSSWGDVDGAPRAGWFNVAAGGAVGAPSCLTRPDGHGLGLLTEFLPKEGRAVGFAVVLFCGHSEMAGVGDAELAVTLAEVVSAGAVPGARDASSGPWRVGGLFHSSATATLVIDATASAASFVDTTSGEAPAPAGAVDPTFTSGQLHEAVRALSRRGGPVSIDEVLGADPLGGIEPVGSLWWFYLDAIGDLHRAAGADPAALGATVREASMDRSSGVVAVGSHVNALNCAARVAPGAVVELQWAGNRLDVGR